MCSVWSLTCWIHSFIDFSFEIACSQTLYSLFKVRRARVIKYKPQGIIDRQRKGVGVGGEEENRRSEESGSNRNLLFPGKASYHWLNGDYPVIIMSTTHHARVMRVEALTTTLNCNLHKQITSIESAADLWTWHGDIIQACVGHFDHNYLLYRSVDYGKRASTVCHNFQANTCTKKSSVRLFLVYWKTWNVVASPLQSIINDKVEAMRVAGISAIALPCCGTMRWWVHSVF